MSDVTAEASDHAVYVRVHVHGAAVLTPAEAEAFAAAVLEAAATARRYAPPKNPLAVARSHAARQAVRVRQARKAGHHTTHPEGE